MKLCALLLLSLAIAGCAPPYSAELNSSARLAGQMSLLGTFGPLDSPGGDSIKAIKFLPIKPTTTTTTLDAFNAGSGFLVSQSQGTESLSLVFEDSNGKMQRVNSIPFPLAGADPNYPLYQYEMPTPTTATTGEILVFKMGPTPTAASVQLYRATLPNGPFEMAISVPTQLLTALFPPVLSVQFFPLLSIPYDRFNFLFDNGIPLDGEGTAVIDGSAEVFGTGSPSTSNGSIFFPGAQKRVLFYNNGQSGSPSRSFASYYDAGQWVCYRWDLSATPATLLSGITHRVDALLTNGDLISTEGATLRIYDPNGSEVLSAGLGALQFCYEAYVGTTPYVFFSLTMRFPHNTWLFRVYSIPTSALRELKD